MKKIQVTKVYRGNFELRDYQIREAYSKKEPIEVDLCNIGITRILSLEEMKNPVKVSGPFTSKFGDAKIKEYKLIAYPIKPKETT